MTDKNLKALDQLQTHFDLKSEDILKIVSYISAGHNLIAAGVSTWSALNGKLTRSTDQLHIPGMMLIGDDTFLMSELMADLSSYQEGLLKTTKPEDMDRVMYLYTLEPTKKALKLHLFTTGVQVHQ